MADERRVDMQPAYTLDTLRGRRAQLDDANELNSFETRMLRKVAQTLSGGGSDAERKRPLCPLERCGVEVLAPLLLGMASWLYDRVLKNRVDHVYFCTRDGIIIRHAFDMFQAYFGKVVETSILYISRQVIYRAQAHISNESTVKLFSQNWSVLTPNQALIRWGIDPLGYSQAISDAGFDSPDETVWFSGGQSDRRFEALFRACRIEIERKNREIYWKLASYLDQERITSKRKPGIVDVGWHGTLQSGLHSFLKSRSHRGLLLGYYYGLIISEVAAAAVPAQGYLFSHDGTPESRIVRHSPSLVEVLHTTEHGTTKSYTRMKTAVIPVFEDLTWEQEQYTVSVSIIQRYALQFIDEFLSETNIEAPEVVSPKIAIAGLSRLLRRPEDDEAKCLGALAICPNYGEFADPIPLGSVDRNGRSLWSSAAKRFYLGS